jgi:amidase
MKNRININELTISELGELLDKAVVSSVDLVNMYLERIEELDKSGPVLKSVLEINPDCLSIAAELDKERAHKGKRSSLHGIPVLIKGNIDTADKMDTNGGSLALEGHKAEKDAFIVKNLRDSGALILGKTNLSEWANFRSSGSSSGWSSMGGQTKNPYAIDRSPCGSSSGSAVAVSSNLCTVAVGTETDGSIICPSQMNGIVGIKPTLGLVSRSGIIPIAHSQDTAGPMGRTVSDAVALLDILTGYDKDDELTEKYKWKGEKDYSRFLNEKSLQNVRIGIARNFFGFHEKVDELMEQTISLLRKGGAVIVDPVEIETKGMYDQQELDVLLYEFKEDINKYLSKVKGNVQSLEQLIEFNNKEKERVMPHFGQDIFMKALGKGSLNDPEYLQALEICRVMSREKGLDLTLRKHNLQAIAAPSGGPAWKIDHVNGDHYSGGSSQMAAVSGYPNITVPMGFISGLPVGISFMGTAFSEPLLIGLAYAFETISAVRREPELRLSGFSR